MASKIKLAISVVIVVIGIAVAIGGSYMLSLQAIHNSDQQWCTALNLLTRTPVPAPSDPKANPSRAQAYQLYEDFVAIKHRYGC